DRVKECEPGKRIVAVKNVSANEPYFQGHFPHRPIMPGVLILEAMAQAAGVLVFRTQSTKPDRNSVYYYVGIDDARFKKPVVPGARRGRARRRGDHPVLGQADLGRMRAIHPTAIVHDGAQLGADVAVGPYSIVGPGVELGEGTWIGAHVVLDGRARIGRRNRIFHFASIGAPPQDKKYAGEDTAVEIGDGNTIREYVTINRGTALDAGVTRVG